VQSAQQAVKVFVSKTHIRAYPCKEVQSICQVLTSGLPSTKELHLIKRARMP
jgi:hypothetical protein